MATALGTGIPSFSSSWLVQNLSAAMFELLRLLKGVSHSRKR
jgi:hypothetical protein